MRFFIDTAKLNRSARRVTWGSWTVTTNPSLMARENIHGHAAIMAHYRQICEMVDGDVSAGFLHGPGRGCFAGGA